LLDFINLEEYNPAPQYRIKIVDDGLQQLKRSAFDTFRIVSISRITGSASESL